MCRPSPLLIVGDRVGGLLDYGFFAVDDVEAGGGGCGAAALEVVDGGGSGGCCGVGGCDGI